MACSNERSRAIGDLVAGRIDSAEAQELLEHLETCSPCSIEFDLASELVATGEGGGLADSPIAVPTLDWRVPVGIAATLLVTLTLWIVFLENDRSRDNGGHGSNLSQLAAVEPLPAVESVLRGDPDQRRNQVWSDAMQRYAAGDYAATIALLAPIAAERPADALTQLYLGVASLETGASADAVAALERAAQHGEGLLTERALWYLAHAQLAQRDVARAIETLQRLIAAEGDYELNARDKLEAVRQETGAGE